MELTAAGTDHPWPGEISSGVFGSTRRGAIARADPTLVVDVAAESALQAGRFGSSSILTPSVPTYVRRRTF